MHSYTEPDWDRAALITIDVQEDFTRSSGSAHVSGTEAILPAIWRLLQAFRAGERSIIHMVRLYSEDGSNVDLCRRQRIESGASIVAPGSEGAELARELKPDEAAGLDPEALLEGEAQHLAEREVVIYKPRWGAFYETPLESYLRKRDLSTLVFCGCNFPNCPRASIYEASERDYRIILVRDGVSGLYDRGAEEMSSIGVQLYTASDVVEAVDA